MLSTRSGFEQQVEVEVAAHAAAGKDADRAVEALRRVPGVLERLPGDLEELAVLRVHDRRFLRAEAEELAVEHLEAVERRRRAHVVPVCAAGPGSRRPRAAPPRSAGGSTRRRRAGWPSTPRSTARPADARPCRRSRCRTGYSSTCRSPASSQRRRRGMTAIPKNALSRPPVALGRLDQPSEQGHAKHEGGGDAGHQHHGARRRPGPPARDGANL